MKCDCHCVSLSETFWSDGVALNHRHISVQKRKTTRLDIKGFFSLRLSRSGGREKQWKQKQTKENKRNITDFAVKKWFWWNSIQRALMFSAWGAGSTRISVNRHVCARGEKKVRWCALLGMRVSSTLSRWFSYLHRPQTMGRYPGCEGQI